MKKNYTTKITKLLLVVLSTLSTFYVSAQCTANAGENFSICEASFSTPYNLSGFYNSSVGYDINQDQENTCMAYLTTADLAQSFTASSTSISGAGIRFRTSDNNYDINIPFNLTISLYDNLPNQGGTLLASGSRNVLLDNTLWADITWQSVPLSVNSIYYLVFSTTSDLAPCIVGSTANPYSGGILYANEGFDSFSGFDYTFRTISAEISWTGTGIESGANTLTPAVNPPVGVTTYTMEISNSAGCSSTSTVTVTRISPLLVQIQTIGNELLANVQGGDAISYQWLSCTPFITPIDGAQSSGYAPTQTGSYGVRVVGLGGCEFSSSCVPFVYSDPCLGNDLDLSGSVNENSITVTPSGGDAPYTISWTGPNGFTAGNETTLSNLPNGSYTATVTDANNCTSIYTGLVDVGTSINRIEKTITNIYPNPTKNVLNIELKEMATVEIFSITGVKISQMNGATNYQFNTSSLADGLYFVKAGEQTLKFVKN